MNNIEFNNLKFGLSILHVPNQLLSTLDARAFLLLAQAQSDGPVSSHSTQIIMIFRGIALAFDERDLVRHHAGFAAVSNRTIFMATGLNPDVVRPLLKLSKRHPGVVRGISCPHHSTFSRRAFWALRDVWPSIGLLAYRVGFFARQLLLA